MIPERQAARFRCVERARPHLRGMLHALALYADEAESWARIYARTSPSRAAALRLRVDAAEYVMGLAPEPPPLARDILRNDALYTALHLSQKAQQGTFAP
jgi:hypothetical protein